MTFQFDLLNQSLSQLSGAIHSRALTSQVLVQACLDQIHDVDRSGLKLNSVLEVSKKALEEAKMLDEEASKGERRSALHGIPMIVGDDIACKDLGFRAGNIAFFDTPITDPTLESPIITHLRASGAILLGKGNIGDLFRAASSVSGWSSRGGQVVCPYNRIANPSGSSTGPAVAVAAGMAGFGVGTQLVGGGIRPASREGVVGFKPSVGALSNEGCFAPLKKTFGLTFYAKITQDIQAIWQVIGPSKSTLQSDEIPPKKSLSQLRLGTLSSHHLAAPNPNELCAVTPLNQEKEFDVTAGGRIAAPQAKVRFDEICMELQTLGCVSKDESKLFKSQVDEKVWMMSALKPVFDEHIGKVDNCKAKNAQELAEFLRDNQHLGHFPSYPKDYSQTDFQAYCDNKTILPIDSPQCTALEKQIFDAYKLPVDAFFEQHQLDAIIGLSDSSVATLADFGGRPIGTLPMMFVEKHQIPAGLCVIGRPGKDEEVLQIMRLIEPLLAGYQAPRAVREGHW